MFILKRLILKEWLKTFLMATLVLLLILTIANLVTGFLRGNVSPYEVIINHLIELPGSFDRIVPVSCLIASLFTINNLKAHNELISILTTGFGRKNIFIIIFQGAFLVAAIQLFISGYIHPTTKSLRNRFIQNSEKKFKNLKSKGLKASTIGSGKLWYKSKGYYFSFGRYDRVKQVLYNVNLFRISSDQKLTQKIFSPKVLFIGANKWEFQDAKSFNSLDGLSFPIKDNNKLIILPLNESPNDFLQLEADITTLSLHKLYNYIAILKSSKININEFETFFYQKIASALVSIIFAIVAAMGIFNPNRRNSSFGKSVTFVFVFTLIYWLINSYFIELGNNGKLQAFYASFFVPFIFTIFVIFQFLKHRKLSK